jgi:dienelactone hydrolase
VQHDQIDVLGWDPKSGPAPKRDRSLTVDLWYPATPAKGASPETYSADVPSEPPAPPTHFTMPGIAVRHAPPEAGRFPLVIVSHGMNYVTAGMTWLTENLASKGYVVAAIRHGDPNTYTPDTPDRFPQVLLRRPLDIAFVTRELQRTLAASGSVDPTRTALIGHSMGGYGVLTAAGATLNPQSPSVGHFPAGILAAYARGGPSADAVRAPSIRAVVAIAPWGGSQSAWSASDLEGITAPLLLISGDRDHTADYKTGARFVFDMAKRSNRYLLTYLYGGHSIGFGGPAPDEMRQNLWNEDWFEDPVWRKERVIGINLHFITAFLDRYLKDDASRSAYLDGLVVESSQGEWPSAPAQTPWAAISPGGAGITLWKGFQRAHAEGLTLMHQDATPSK